MPFLDEEILEINGDWMPWRDASDSEQAEINFSQFQILKTA